jgi:hypothetical protein
VERGAENLVTGLYRLTLQVLHKYTQNNLYLGILGTAVRYGLVEHGAGNLVTGLYCQTPRVLHKYMRQNLLLGILGTAVRYKLVECGAGKLVTGLYCLTLRALYQYTRGNLIGDVGQCSEVRVGGMLSGKAGLLYCHMVGFLCAPCVYRSPVQLTRCHPRLRWDCLRTSQTLTWQNNQDLLFAFFVSSPQLLIMSSIRIQQQGSERSTTQGRHHSIPFQAGARSFRVCHDL